MFKSFKSRKMNLTVIGLSFLPSVALANNIKQQTIESSRVGYKRVESQALIKKRNESAILGGYTGVVGTAPKKTPISAAGGAFELYPNGTNYYGYFSQTLANGLYYEGRLYTRYNYLSANPMVSVPDSNVNNPMGYGVALFLGYNFNISPYLDIVPYIRFNDFYDMVVTYANSNGDHYNSHTYSYILGSKFTFRYSKIFTPYLNLFATYQQSFLKGGFPSAGHNMEMTGVLDQSGFTYEIGVASKVSEHMALIPYFQYITIANYPDSAALTKVNNGGFGMSDLTNAFQVYGLKLNIAW